MGEFLAGGLLRRGMMVASGLGPAADAALGLGGDAFTAHPRQRGGRLVRGPLPRAIPPPGSSFTVSYTAPRLLTPRLVRPGQPTLDAGPLPFQPRAHGRGCPRPRVVTSRQRPEVYDSCHETRAILACTCVF